MTPVVAVCDYGVGNLRSVERALLAAGADVRVTTDAAVLESADGVILPGVGAFGAAAAALDERGLARAISAAAAAGKPVLGVCLGHQLLFDSSEESASLRGLGLLRGRVERLHPAPGKVPHIGWNRLEIVRRVRLLDGVESGCFAYFVHSYAALAEPADVAAVTDHGGSIAAVVAHANVMGVQFHPEKSGAAGLRLYANFVAMCRAPLAAAQRSAA